MIVAATVHVVGLEVVVVVPEHVLQRIVADLSAATAVGGIACVCCLTLSFFAPPQLPLGAAQ
ncbi:hypothetical protein D3C85_1581500 [compost metagenome]